MTYSKRNCQFSTLYLLKLSFTYEGKIKTFPDNKKWIEFFASRHDPREFVKETFRLKIHRKE